MFAKAIFVFSVQCLLAQIISCQFIGTAYDGLGWGANGLAWDVVGPYGSLSPWNAAPYAASSWAVAPCIATPYATAEWATGYAPATLTTSNGGGFAVTSSSPLAATGVALTSENAYEGGLAVTGALPFLSAVALEGPLPTLGTGGVTYFCGNGNVAMLNEDIGLAGYNAFASPYGAYSPAEFGYGYGSPLGYEATIAGPGYGYRGCEYGALY